MESIAVRRQHLVTLTELHKWDEIRSYMLTLIDDLAMLGLTKDNPAAQWFVECAEQACISPNITEPLAQLRGENAAKRQAYRMANSEELKHLHVIPAGCECHPWVLLNRWGFRTDIGSLNHLSLGIHRMPGLISLLESGFANYARPETLSTRLHPPSGTDMAVDDSLGITWNHHRGSHWTDNQFWNLQTQSASLIETFNRDCKRPNAIFAISQWRGFDPATSGQMLDRILNALVENGALNPKIVIMDFSGTIPEGVISLRETVALISNPYPAGYSWSGMNYYNSDEGFAWEQKVVLNFLEACQLLEGSAALSVGASSEML